MNALYYYKKHGKDCQGGWKSCSEMMIEFADHRTRKVPEMIKFYQGKIDDIGRKYVGYNTKKRGTTDYKPISKRDLELTNIYEDFLADLRTLLNKK